MVFCYGKVSFYLLEARRADEVRDVASVRVEQLYPFPAKALITELSRFRNAEMVWCQEEPKNMGAWSFIDPYLEWVLAQEPWIVPIPGTTKFHRLRENLGAVSLHLTPEDLRALESAAAKIKVQGARYPEHLQKLVGR